MGLPLGRLAAGLCLSCAAGLPETSALALGLRQGQTALTERHPERPPLPQTLPGTLRAIEEPMVSSPGSAVWLGQAGVRGSSARRQGWGEVGQTHLDLRWHLSPFSSLSLLPDRQKPAQGGAEVSLCSQGTSATDHLQGSQNWVCSSSLSPLWHKRPPRGQKMARVT